MEENLPPGFRFHPTDEELISYYLTRKVSDFGFVATAIADVDLNKCEPWDLPGKASMGEKEWYFFSLRDRKYPTGLRTNRATDAGYWKTTGKDKEIFQHGMLVGLKKTLVFYKGRAPKGEKTNWVMHQYKRQTKFPYRPSKEEWVICRVFRKSTSGKKPHPNASSLLESPCNTTSLQDELGEMDVSALSNLVSHLGSSYAMQTNDSSSTNSSSSNKVDMDLYMSWVLASWEASNQPFVSWPSSLVSSASPSAQPMVLPFAGYQPIQGSGMTMSSIDEHGDPSSLVAESKAIFPGSRAKAAVQAAQQSPFDQELFWRGY